MLGRWIQSWSRSSQRRMADEFLRFLRTGSDAEVCTILFSAHVLRQSLRASATRGPFPDDAFALRAESLSAERSRELWRYSASLGSFHNSIIKKRARVGSSEWFLAPGIPVWRISIWAVLDHELWSRGRELWAELERGRPHLPAWVEHCRTEGFLTQDFTLPDLSSPHALCRPQHS